MNASAVYQRQAVLTAGPARLVGMLYDEALAACERAQRILASDSPDLGEVSQQLGLAQRIVTELELALDHERGEAIAKSLAALYGFCRRRLVDANLRKETEPIAEALNILVHLRRAWRTVEEQSEVTA